MLEFLFVNQMSNIYQKIESFYRTKIFLCYNLESKKQHHFFNLKDKTSHISYVVYEEKCNCGKNYIGEKGRNVTLAMNIVT